MLLCSQTVLQFPSTRITSNLLARYYSILLWLCFGLLLSSSFVGFFLFRLQSFHSFSLCWSPFLLRTNHGRNWDDVTTMGFCAIESSEYSTNASTQQTLINFHWNQWRRRFFTQNISHTISIFSIEQMQCALIHTISDNNL